MPKQIYFPPVDPVWEFDRDVVRFYAVVDKMTIVCNVTIEALFQHFGARNPDVKEAMRAFMSFRPLIEDAARRKIEREMTPGQREILLTTDDFLTTPSSPSPVTFQRFEPTVSDAVRSSPSIMDAVHEANQFLLDDLVRGRDHITAEWNLVPGSSSPLLSLTLTDKATRASAEGYFTPEDLRTGPIARFSLFRLWDELLRNKATKILEDAHEVPQ